MTVAFGELTMSRTQVQLRYSRFKENREDVSGDARRSVKFEGFAYSLTSTPNNTFLGNFFMEEISEFLPEICLEEFAKEIFFHISFLITDLRNEPRLLRLISRYTTY